MSKRHPTNRNLTLLELGVWRGNRVITNHGPLVNEYLERIDQVIDNAVDEHRRTYALRVELKFPVDFESGRFDEISRFFESLKAKIEADRERKLRADKRAHPCRVRYIWVRERDTGLHDHFHVCLFLNHDAYFTVGNFRRTSAADPCAASDMTKMRNLMTRLQESWASALGVPVTEVAGLVNIPRNAEYLIDANDSDYWDERGNLFYRLSYFAKVATKHYGRGTKNFGASRF